MEAQNTDWQQLARVRRDIAKVARRLAEPYQEQITCVTAEQRQDLEACIGEPGRGKQRVRGPKRRRRQRRRWLGATKERSPANREGASDAILCIDAISETLGWIEMPKVRLNVRLRNGPREIRRTEKMRASNSTIDQRKMRKKNRSAPAKNGRDVSKPRNGHRQLRLLCVFRYRPWSN